MSCHGLSSACSDDPYYHLLDLHTQPIAMACPPRQAGRGDGDRQSTAA
jgi:hypothetical protein